MTLLIKATLLLALQTLPGPLRAEACDRAPIEGLIEHTLYRGDACTFSTRVAQKWDELREEIQYIRRLQNAFTRAGEPQIRTDALMELGRQTIRLRGKMHSFLRNSLSSVGESRFRFVADPQTEPGSDFVGFDFQFTHNWREHSWPWTDHTGEVLIKFSLRQDPWTEAVEICLNGECRLVDSGLVSSRGIFADR